MILLTIQDLLIVKHLSESLTLKCKIVQWGVDGTKRVWPVADIA